MREPVKGLERGVMKCTLTQGDAVSPPWSFRSPSGMTASVRQRLHGVSAGQRLQCTNEVLFWHSMESPPMRPIRTVKPLTWQGEGM
jgi:hypothetical protein